MKKQTYDPEDRLLESSVRIIKIVEQSFFDVKIGSYGGEAIF